MKVYLTGIATKRIYILISKLVKNLSNDFQIQFTKNNPDYLIYNCYNDKDLNIKYKNAIRIAFYTENMMPDLNNADYAFGNFHIILKSHYFFI